MNNPLLTQALLRLHRDADGAKSSIDASRTIQDVVRHSHLHVPSFARALARQQINAVSNHAERRIDLLLKQMEDQVPRMGPSELVECFNQAHLACAQLRGDFPRLARRAYDLTQAVHKHQLAKAHTTREALPSAEHRSTRSLQPRG